MCTRVTFNAYGCNCGTHSIQNTTHIHKNTLTLFNRALIFVIYSTCARRVFMINPTTRTHCFLVGTRSSVRNVHRLFSPLLFLFVHFSCLCVCALPIHGLIRWLFYAQYPFLCYVRAMSLIATALCTKLPSQMQMISDTSRQPVHQQVRR